MSIPLLTEKGNQLDLHHAFIFGVSRRQGLVVVNGMLLLLAEVERLRDSGIFLEWLNF